MRSLAAILTLLLATQPLAAGYCGVESSAGRDTHGAVQHDAADRHSAHDCCAPDEGNADSECLGIDHCGACASVMPLVFAPSGLWTFSGGTEGFRLAANRLTPSHTIPPFRPPITIS